MEGSGRHVSQLPAGHRSSDPRIPESCILIHVVVYGLYWQHPSAESLAADMLRAPQHRASKTGPPASFKMTNPFCAGAELLSLLLLWSHKQEAALA